MKSIARDIFLTFKNTQKGGDILLDAESRQGQKHDDVVEMRDYDYLNMRQ